MTVMSIETLAPSEGAVPSNSYDAASQTGYTLWDVNDEARFSIVVPDDYMSGSDFFLSIRDVCGTGAPKGGFINNTS